MTTTWSEVQRKASTPGSTVLAKWNAERARVKNATYSSDVMESFGVYPTAASGAAVTPLSAMRVSAVFACVQRIAGTIATLPIHVYERTATGRKRIDSPLWYLLNEQPTPRYTAASHWESTVASFLLKGDSFTFIARDGMGNPKEFIPLPWEAVQVVRDLTQVGGKLIYNVHDVAKIFGALPEDIFHFPGFGFNGVRSMSVIQYAARNATGTAAAMDEYSGKFFAGGAHPSIVLQSDSKMGPDQVKNLQAAFAAKYSGVDNAHRLPLVLTEGLKASPLSVNAEDSQLLDARKFQVVDIARAFGVPPHLIGETSAATSWGSGIESMSRGFVTYTLQSHLKRIEQELNRKLWPRSLKYFVEFDRDVLIEGDSAAQSAYFRAALGGPGTGVGWMTVDEVRAKKNLEPMGGDSAELYDPREVEPPDTNDVDPPETNPAEPSETEKAAASMAASFAIMAAREPVAPVVNVAAPVVNVTNNLPEVAPVFEATVEAPVVNMAAPEIHVPATVINVATPPPRRFERTPVRDAITGLITSIIEQEVE